VNGVASIVLITAATSVLIWNEANGFKCLGNLDVDRARESGVNIAKSGIGLGSKDENSNPKDTSCIVDDLARMSV
jgi:hypothetical protein